MTGYIALVVIVLAVIAALEISNRRHSGPEGTFVSRSSDDRDVARTKLDLLALGAAAKPFNHKPASTTASVQTIRTARLLHHGRHAA